jgi:hypothetical protein
MCGATQRCCSGFGYARGSSLTYEGCCFIFLLDQKGNEFIFIHTFFLIKKYAKTQGRTKLLRSRPLRWPAVLPGLAFCIECMVWFFTTPVFDHPSVGGEWFWLLC